MVSTASFLAARPISSSVAATVSSVAACSDATRSSTATFSIIATESGTSSRFINEGMSACSAVDVSVTY